MLLTILSNKTAIPSRKAFIAHLLHQTEVSLHTLVIRFLSSSTLQTLLEAEAGVMEEGELYARFAIILDVWLFNVTTDIVLPTDNTSFSCTLNLYTIKLSLISRLFSHLSFLFFHCVDFGFIFRWFRCIFALFCWVNFESTHGIRAKGLCCSS